MASLRKQAASGGWERHKKKPPAESGAPPSTLYYGDNLDVLRRHVKDESVDLVYLDPPFNSNQDYNVLFEEHTGQRSVAQIAAFEDTWHWDEAAERTYTEVVDAGGRVGAALRAMRAYIGGSDMLAYLAMMAPRLTELRRVLKPTGSIYLHCDPTAGHYLKVLMDAVFSPGRFLNEIVWLRSNAHNIKTRMWPRQHDTLLLYARGDTFTLNHAYQPYGPEQMKRYKPDADGRLYKAENLTVSLVRRLRQFEWRGTKPPPHRSWGASRERLEEWYAAGRILLKEDGKPRLDGLKVYLDEMKGKVVGSVWTDIPRLSNTTAERLGYPTQKPESLLERIISASSNEGDVILDPFCGCGTAVAVAQRLKRRWIGIDITHLAITLIKHRLADAQGAIPKREYVVVGEPTDAGGAEALADEDKWQFQWWALGLVGARPAPAEQRKGPDQGVDGRLFFHDEAAPEKGFPAAASREIVLSVKGGHLKATDVRDLRGVLEREKATIGVLLSLEEPTAAMRAEAASAGFYTSPWGKHARLQLLTVVQLLEGKRLDCPPLRQTDITFKRAPKPTGSALVAETPGLFGGAAPIKPRGP